MADQSQTSTGLSVYVYGGLHKVLTLPATVLFAKPNSVMFLSANTTFLYILLLMHLPLTSHLLR